MAYVDTSVLVAYYCPEALSPKVQKLLGGMDELTISPLVDLELRSAVGIKVRTKQLNATDARRVLAMFQAHLKSSYFRIVAIEGKEYDLARSWLADFGAGLRTLDALHLAAAFSNGQTLVTADRTLARAAKRLGVRRKLISTRP